MCLQQVVLTSGELFVSYIFKLFYVLLPAFNTMFLQKRLLISNTLEAIMNKYGRVLE